jgi:hypothetical protein
VHRGSVPALSLRDHHHHAQHPAFKLKLARNSSSTESSTQQELLTSDSGTGYLFGSISSGRMLSTCP